MQVTRWHESKTCGPLSRSTQPIKWQSAARWMASSAGCSAPPRSLTRPGRHPRRSVAESLPVDREAQADPVRRFAGDRMLAAVYRRHRALGLVLIWRAGQ